MGKIPENILSKITAKILHGLVFLHKKHMVHRDIKVGGIERMCGGLAFNPPD